MLDVKTKKKPVPCKKHAWNWLFCRMDSVDSEVFLEALEVEDVKILALYFEQAILLHR